jgi:hypothetical protein
MLGGVPRAAHRVLSTALACRELALRRGAVPAIPRCLTFPPLLEPIEALSLTLRRQLINNALTLISQTLTPIRGRLTVVCDAVALIGDAVALIGDAVALIGDLLALIGHPLTLVHDLPRQSQISVLTILLAHAA